MGKHPGAWPRPIKEVTTMSGYATPQLELTSRPLRRDGNRIDPRNGIDSAAGNLLLDALIDQLAERVAERLAATSLSRSDEPSSADDWFDSRHAADYLGVHRDTLRKLAAERAIPSEQDGPNCKLYFRRSDLDAWRRSGGRPRHLAATLQRVP